MQAREIVEEVLRLITETDGSAETGISLATNFVQKQIHNIKIQSYREAGQDEMALSYINSHGPR